MGVTSGERGRWDVLSLCIHFSGMENGVFDFVPEGDPKLSVEVVFDAD